MLLNRLRRRKVHEEERPPISVSVWENLRIARMMLPVPVNSALWAERAPLTLRLCSQRLAIEALPPS